MDKDRDFVVVAPLSDTVHVCNFMRAEKAGAIPLAVVERVDADSAESLRAIAVADVRPAADRASLDVERLVVARRAENILIMLGVMR